MYQSFAMEAQTDATRCCIIVILLSRLSLEEGGVIRASMEALPSQYQHCPRFPKNVCWNDTWPIMGYHHSFLVDDCITNKLEIDEKLVFLILFASLTLKWCRCDFDMTGKAQLLLILLFAHKLRTCKCLQTNLTLQSSLILISYICQKKL